MSIDNVRAVLDPAVSDLSSALSRLEATLPVNEGGHEAGRLRRSLVNAREHLVCALACAEGFVSRQT